MKPDYSSADLNLLSKKITASILFNLNIISVQIRVIMVLSQKCP